jgi:hypothetical protein
VIPLYEQLLEGMGVGAVSSTVVWCGAWMALTMSTCDPPHEQLLMGMEWMLCQMSLSTSGEGGRGIISVMWQVNEGMVYIPGGSWYTGLPLSSPLRSLSLSPIPFVVCCFHHAS